jgi:hypothetical protein
LTVLVTDGIRKVVAFLGVKEGGEFKPRATCFFVSVYEQAFQFTYLVTADHVVAAMRGANLDVWVRINHKDGAVEELILPPDNWIHFPNEDATDVAAVSIQFTGPEDVNAVCVHGARKDGLDKQMIVNADVIVDRKIGIGEEVFIVGMFRSHYGLKKNIPVVRIGNISAMPEEPILTEGYGYVEAYLVEARSIGGLSGSPVFVNMPPVRIVDGQTSFVRGPQYYLLGLMHGHFDIPDMNADVVLEDHGNNGTINTGMGVVIPATKIAELLLQDSLTEHRKEMVRLHLAGTATTTPDQS